MKMMGAEALRNGNDHFGIHEANNFCAIRGCVSVSANLELVPITLEEANEFIRKHHRHNKPVPGAKFCVACASNGTICGVAVCGRPVARLVDDGWTLEVNRVATDGTRNANSLLYGACRRAAWALGYKKLITYTLAEEAGSSLRGTGFRLIGKAGGGSWSRESRPRVDRHPLQEKLKWECLAPDFS
jgi:hypothetical protein